MEWKLKVGLLKVELTKDGIASEGIEKITNMRDQKAIIRL
jgi:hypothetical protein